MALTKGVSQSCEQLNDYVKLQENGKYQHLTGIWQESPSPIGEDEKQASSTNKTQDFKIKMSNIEVI